MRKKRSNDEIGENFHWKKKDDFSTEKEIN